MNVVQFSLLPIKRQIGILYRHGVYIGKRKDAKQTVLLLQLEAFYVEVHYQDYRRHIQWINCFESTDLLDPYLENMDVADLVV